MSSLKNDPSNKKQILSVVTKNTNWEEKNHFLRFKLFFQETKFKFVLRLMKRKKNLSISWVFSVCGRFNQTSWTAENVKGYDLIRFFMGDGLVCLIEGIYRGIIGGKLEYTRIYLHSSFLRKKLNWISLSFIASQSLLKIHDQFLAFRASLTIPIIPKICLSIKKWNLPFINRKCYFTPSYLLIIHTSLLYHEISSIWVRRRKYIFQGLSLVLISVEGENFKMITLTANHFLFSPKMKTITMFSKFLESIVGIHICLDKIDGWKDDDFSRWNFKSFSNFFESFSKKLKLKNRTRKEKNQWKISP